MPRINSHQRKAGVSAGLALQLRTLVDGGLLSREVLAFTHQQCVTCGAALAEWMEWRRTYAAPNTVETQRAILSQMLRQLRCRTKPVSELQFEQLDGFVNASDPTSLSTRRLRVASIRSYFRFLSAKSYHYGDPSALLRIRMNNLSHLQKEPRRRVPFTEDEFRTVFSATTGFWHAATALSYWTGLRLSDIAAMERASVLPAQVIVWTRKTGARVALPLDDPLIGSGELRDVLRRILSANVTSRHLFPVQRAIVADPRRRACLSVEFGRILEQLSIEGKSFHSLRHSFATRLAQAGKTLEEIGLFVGHRCGATTELYVNRQATDGRRNVH